MSKVTWSVPLVQFGRFEVEFELEGAQNSPQELGRQYALFTADVMRGYEAEREKIAAELVKEKTKDYPEHDEPHPATELTEEEAQDLFENELGATVVGKTPVWDEPVEKAPEPWKNQGPVKKITDIQF